MSRKRKDRARSVNQRIGNEGRRRRLTRQDAFTAYAMGRLLFRLGQSPQAKEFFLKGGVLVANLVEAPHRFTRDIDVLRRHGPPDPNDLRMRFEAVVSGDLADGITWGRVKTRRTEREDDYDGVKVFIEARVERHQVELRVDVGFGDATEPEPTRRALTPFLPDDPPAELHAYQPETVIAEKVETLLRRFPLIEHRLKDLLDVVVLAGLSRTGAPEEALQRPR
ncbi:MAG: putative nucleotidyltransferase component of viral defense system [Cognaticolwellia sp.]|jgi:predicted nucleotidyltransferase component of viral defense system